jgi:hypothetical protein
LASAQRHASFRTRSRTWIEKNREAIAVTLLRGQRRLLQVGGDPDYGVDQCGGDTDPEGRAGAGLQIEVLRVNAYGGEARKHPSGGTADRGGKQSLKPYFEFSHDADGLF